VSPELEKPVVFLDIEATGVWPEKDRIVEIALIKVYPDGREETYETRIDPEMKMPAAVLAIHGIRDEDLVGKPKFKEVAPKILGFLEGSDIGGFGLERLDVHILAKEFSRAGFDFDFGLCFFVDAQKIYHSKEKRNLSAACQFYLGKPLENAHSAMADARASLDIFKAQTQKYPDLPKTAKELFYLTRLDDASFVDESRRFRWWSGEVYLNFGNDEVYGKSLKSVVKERRGFLDWMLNQKFSKEVKRIVQDALEGKFPQEPKVSK
jgi:DNA polymerase-3 subunit epsilon